VVQLLSLGAPVLDGVGPEADALTFLYPAEKLRKQKTAKMAAVITDNLIKTTLREIIGIFIDNSLGCETFTCSFDAFRRLKVYEKHLF
jgi:hypothetical protein